MVSSALAVLASSGWTPQGITESQTPIKAHILTGTDNTWISDGASYSGISTNWQNDSLTTGQNVWFTSAHVGACTWNNSLGVTSFGSFNIKTGYSGIITLAATFSVTSYYQSGGTFTANNAYMVTDSGDFTHIGGTLTSTVLQLKMTGTNKAISLAMPSSFYFAQLIVSGTSSLTHGGANTYVTGAMTLAIDPGGILTLVDYFVWVQYWGTYTNSGIIAGSALFKIVFNADFTWTAPGTITSPVDIYLHNGAATNKTFTLGAPLSCGPLTVRSDHITYFATLSTSTYAVSTTTLTLGARGIITQGTGTITCTNYTQSGVSSLFTQGGSIDIGSGGFWLSDGTFVGSASYNVTDAGNFMHTGGTLTSTVLQLKMTGANKAIHLAMASSFYFRLLTIAGSCSFNHTEWPFTSAFGLTVDAGAILTLNAPFHWVSYWGNYSNNGTINGSYLFDMVYDSNVTWIPGILTCPIYLELHIGSPAYAAVTLLTTLTTYTINVTSTVATIIFVVSGLKSGGGIMYNVYVDGDRIEQIRCDSGSITFSYSGPWSEHTFEVVAYDPWGPIYDMGPVMLWIGVIVGLTAIVLVMVGSRIKRA